VGGDIDIHLFGLPGWQAFIFNPADRMMELNVEKFLIDVEMFHVKVGHFYL
jgi:hypothetical protein